MRLLELQSEILKLVALGEDLTTVADTLCGRVEAIVDDAICSILTIDRSGLLHPLAGPSLPDHYSAALDGFPIGPAAGSCGTAAFRNEEVIVTDIATDPLWEVPRALALPLGLKACWSSPIHAEDGRVVATFAFYYRVCRGPNPRERRIVETCVDLCAIAIRHHETRRHISQLAFVDALTDLPNRTAFERHASDALSSRGCEPVGIHYLDLDDFKGVNDTYGHRTGDALLAQVGARLRGAVEGRAFVARLGGDEFGICAPGDQHRQEELAGSILTALSTPIAIAGHEFDIGVSIGIAMAPQHGSDLGQLCQAADLALYRVKSDGAQACRVFSGEMKAAACERSAIKADLRLALARHEFQLVYQPIVDVRTQAACSFEALIRWRHPERGLVPPDRFIPLAEETGLIAEIGRWVLRQAIEDAACWPAAIGVAVNVSPLQLEREGFACDVATALGDGGLLPGRLTIEVTETALFDRGAVTRKSLQDLKTLGVAIALDDFGTGFSSLSLIRDRRFDKLKIDRSFVEGLGIDPDCDAIVASIIALARKMGLRTTAEGIETASQMRWLAEHGCDEGQGYVVSRPLAARDVAGFLDPIAPRAAVRHQSPKPTAPARRKAP